MLRQCVLAGMYQVNASAAGYTATTGNHTGSAAAGATGTAVLRIFNIVNHIFSNVAGAQAASVPAGGVRDVLELASV